MKWMQVLMRWMMASLFMVASAVFAAVLLRDLKLASRRRVDALLPLAFFMVAEAPARFESWRAAQRRPPERHKVLGEGAGQGAPKLRPLAAASITALRMAGWLCPSNIGPQEPM